MSSTIDIILPNSFEKYSLQQFDNFNSKDFMDFAENNIFEYLS